MTELKHSCIVHWQGYAHSSDQLIDIRIPLLLQILEQVEGGDLIVNKGNESRPKSVGQCRELNVADNLDVALKLAEVGGKSLPVKLIDMFHFRRTCMN